MDLDIFGRPVPLFDFMLFTANPDIKFDLLTLKPGIYSSTNCIDVPIAGQTCTPVGSPFNFINTTANASEMSFSVFGIALNAATGENSNFNGTFVSAYDVPYLSDLDCVSIDRFGAHALHVTT